MLLSARRCSRAGPAGRGTGIGNPGAVGEERNQTPAAVARRASAALVATHPAEEVDRDFVSVYHGNRVEKTP